MVRIQVPPSLYGILARIVHTNMVRPGYAPLDPGPPAYSFDTTRPYPVQRMDVMQATPVEAYTPTTVAAAASPFTSETPQFSQYDLPQYPPLQPTRNIAAAHPMQPLGKRPEIPYADDVFARPDGRPMAGRTSADFDHVTATHLPPSMPKPTSAATLDASLLRTTPVQPMMAADGRQDYFAIHPTTAAAAAAAATAQARFAVPPPPSTCSQPPQDTRGESELQVVFPHQRPPRATRGPFKSHIEREKTARTRKIGSCIRCKMQRIRVSGPQRRIGCSGSPRVCGLVCVQHCS